MNIGIAFSGGGVKGAAHIGVIKAFEEENIEFNYISGTSSGSIVATLYACGYKSAEIYELFKKYCSKIKYVEIKNVVKGIAGLIFKRQLIIDGLNSGEKIFKIITEACEQKNIKNINEIKKTLIIPSVDLYDGKLYVFSSKEFRNTYSNKLIYQYNVPIGTAVQASCSYPVIFSPCKYNNTKLIDGGIRENIPWKQLKIAGAEKVVGIVFEKNIKDDKKNKNIIDVASRALDLISYELSQYETVGVDYMLKIKTKEIELLEIDKIDYLYNIGYEIAKKNMSKIKNIINNKRNI